jgi:hypothetical protein
MKFIDSAITSLDLLIVHAYSTGTGTGTVYHIYCRDAPDIRPDNSAFFDIRYPAGYQIALPYRYPVRPDAGYPAGYPANVKLNQ